MHIEENQYTLSTPSEHGYNMIRFKLFLKLTSYTLIIPSLFSLGSGYDEWYICIKDKLKNVRRKSDEPSATCRKKLKMSDKILTGKLLNNSLCNVVYLMT
jgi:hypothetical protein